MCCCRLQLNPDGVHLYCFPKDLARRKNWANQVRRTRDKWEPSDHSRLCSKHSENDYFETYGRLSESLGLVKTKSLLKPDAVPIIFEKPASLKRQSKRCSNSN